MMANPIVYEVNLRDNLTPGIDNAEQHAGRLEKTLMHVGEAVAAAFAIEKIFDFGQEILHLTAEFQGYDNIIKFSSLDTADAKANMDYLNDAITRLHLPIKEATEAFAETQAGMYGTSIEGQKLRDVFEGISEASTVLHLSSESFSRVTYALKEIGELGTVQTRQMRMLAFALPGAMSLAAQSMNMNSQKFHEAMEKNEINSATFLQNFSAKLKETFGAGLANAGHSLIANMNDTQNSITSLKLEIGNELEPVFISIMEKARDFVGVLKDVWEWGEKNRQTLNELAHIAAVAGTAFLVYKGIMLGMTAATQLAVLWQGIQYASINVLGDGFLTASAGAKILAAAKWALNAAWEANPIGVVIAGLTVVAVAVYSAWNHFATFRSVVLGVWETLKGFAHGVADIFGGLWHVIHGVFSFDPSEIILGKKEALDGMFKAGQGLGESFKKGWDEGQASFAADHKGLIPTANTATKKTSTATTPIVSKEPKTKATGSKNVTINITIKELVHNLEIKTTTLMQSTAQIRDEITKALTAAVANSTIVAGQM